MFPDGTFTHDEIVVAAAATGSGDEEKAVAVPSRVQLQAIFGARVAALLPVVHPPSPSRRRDRWPDS